MYGCYFETKEQAEEYKKKHELYVMVPFFSQVKKKWCLIFDLKVKDSIKHLVEGKMKSIRKKILPEYFESVKARKKNFELRKDDDCVQEGDLLVLCEFIPDKGYTGREVSRRIKYILRNCPEYGLENGYCIIGW